VTVAGRRQAARAGAIAAGVALLAAAGVALVRSETGARAAARPAPGPAAAHAAPAPHEPAAPTPPPLGAGWLAMHPPPALDVHAESGVLVDLDAGEVMWARDERTPRPPASLAKLLTAMVAADLATSLDQPVTVPAEATQVEGDSTVMGLSAGETLTVRELVAGTFLVSGNDAAETLARGLTDRGRFVSLMNDRAAALGMRDSRFSNPTGLDDPGLRASAYDLAIAAAALAARYPALLALAGARELALPATATHGAYALRSLIKLVSTYPGATGLKTGYTDDAGYCLVGTAARADRHLAVVLLHSDLALTADAAHLLDYGFGVPRPAPLDPSLLAGF
jgi:D-alanyl-D-alanine carboxypeptidase (penicillin-binding protein 5/6)